MGVNHQQQNRLAEIRQNLGLLISGLFSLELTPF